MTIVITDGYTLNPGDLDWVPLNTFGRFIYYDRSTPQQVIERCKEADIIICNKVPITKAVIDAAPNLKLDHRYCHRHNNVDVAAAKERGGNGLQRSGIWHMVGCAAYHRLVARAYQ